MINQQDLISTAQYPSLHESIRSICKVRPTASLLDSALDLFRNLQSSEELSEIFVLDDCQHIQGIITRSCLLQKFSGEFGFNLNRKKTAAAMMYPTFLSVDADTSILKTAADAMNRPMPHVYDAIAITENGCYCGCVTVKELLLRTIRIREQNAADANPLTGLPGNAAVQSAISDALHALKSHSVIYLDIDNFKPFNDAYGFLAGDQMIVALAFSLKQSAKPADFIGHIGGDDFVMVTPNTDVQSLCQSVIDTFSKQIQPLYTPADLSRGYIDSKDRNGLPCQFGLATLSISAVTNISQIYRSMEQLSEAITSAKAQSKHRSGHAITIL